MRSTIIPARTRLRGTDLLIVHQVHAALGKQCRVRSLLNPEDLEVAFPIPATPRVADLQAECGSTLATLAVADMQQQHGKLLLRMDYTCQSTLQCDVINVL